MHAALSLKAAPQVRAACCCRRSRINAVAVAGITDEAQFLVADVKCERCGTAAAGHFASCCRLFLAVAEARSLSLSLKS